LALGAGLMSAPRYRRALMHKKRIRAAGHLRGLRLSLLPRTRHLTHAVFLQTSASITLLCGRLSANAACLCCRTRRAGRAPSGTSTCLWPIHLKSTLQVFVGAFTAESWRLLGAYRCRTPRKVKGHGGVGNREVRRGLGFSASDESDARFGSLGLIRWDAARVKYSLPDL
jgi:hypothetical protein